MRTRTAAVLVAVITGLSVLVLPASPAVADTTTLSPTGGGLQFFDFNDGLQDTLDLEAPCFASSGSLTATGSSSGSLTLVVTDLVYEASLLGDDYLVTIQATFTGSYTGSGSTMTLVGNVVMAMDPLGSDCTATSADDCTIDVGGLALSGTTDATLPTFDDDDTSDLTGGSSVFSVLVSTGCPGPLSALNDGYVVATLPLAKTATVAGSIRIGAELFPFPPAPAPACRWSRDFVTGFAGTATTGGWDRAGKVRLPVTVGGVSHLLVTTFEDTSGGTYAKPGGTYTFAGTYDLEFEVYTLGAAPLCTVTLKCTLTAKAMIKNPSGHTGITATLPKPRTNNVTTHTADSAVTGGQGTNAPGGAGCPALLQSKTVILTLGTLWK